MTVERIAYWCTLQRPEASPKAVETVQALPVWPHAGRFPDAVHIAGSGTAWLIGNEGAAGAFTDVTARINARAIDWHRSTTDAITCLWLSNAPRYPDAP